MAANRRQYPEVAAVLKKMRADSGLTQPALAEASGLDSSTVTRYESGERRPTAESCKRLAAALGVDRNALLLVCGYAPDYGSGPVTCRSVPAQQHSATGPTSFASLAADDPRRATITYLWQYLSAGKALGDQMMSDERFDLFSPDIREMMAAQMRVLAEHIFMIEQLWKIGLSGVGVPNDSERKTA